MLHAPYITACYVFDLALIWLITVFICIGAEQLIAQMVICRIWLYLVFNRLRAEFIKGAAVGVQHGIFFARIIGDFFCVAVGIVIIQRDGNRSVVQKCLRLPGIVKCVDLSGTRVFKPQLGGHNRRGRLTEPCILHGLDQGCVHLLGIESGLRYLQAELQPHQRRAQIALLLLQVNKQLNVFTIQHPGLDSAKLICNLLNGHAQRKEILTFVRRQLMECTICQ